MRVHSLFRPKIWDMALRGWDPVSQSAIYMHLISGTASGGDSGEEAMLKLG
jgi:hypothetical protein